VELGRKSLGKDNNFTKIRILYSDTMVWYSLGEGANVMPYLTEGRWQRRFIVGAVVLLLALAAAWIVWLRRGAYLELEGIWCRGRESQIAFSMMWYLEKNHHFPPAYVEDSGRKRMTSWRVAALAADPCQPGFDYDFS
jgi:hypothetical protein